VRYRQTALIAFREVSDALISRQRLEETRAQQARAVSAYQKAVEISTERYVNGKAGYFEVLEAQQQLFPSENRLAQIELNRRLILCSCTSRSAADGNRSRRQPYHRG